MLNTDNLTRQQFYHTYCDDIHAINRIVENVVRQQRGNILDSQKLFKTIFEYIYLYSDKKPLRYV
jgi:hypothetical protein